MRCQDEPNLLDAIALGIYKFLCDGEVFDQVMITLVTRDPKYFGQILANCEDTVTNKVCKVFLE